MEGYIALFQNEPDGNKPHFKGYIKIEGIDHEFALWPAKEGKKGFTGKFKPKGEKPVAKPAEATVSIIADDLIPF